MGRSDMSPRLGRITIVCASLMLAAAAASAQSAGEVERCFQNPAACGRSGAGGGAPPPATAAPPAATRPPPAPDYAAVLQGTEAERKRIQESLKTLDRYSGPIDGNLQSNATVKAIQDWQKGRGSNPVGKLTPPEAQQLNAEAARAPIRRIEPPAQTATASPTPLAPTAQPSNVDALKALQARIAERRKAAEPKAEAATQSLIRDLKAYASADGKGVAGEQFPAFASLYADAKAADRTVGEIAPVIDDYGDGKAGAVVASEVLIETRRDDSSQSPSSQSHCLVFAWVEGSPRRNTRTFSCDDVAGVEKWKTDQALKSAWR